MPVDYREPVGCEVWLLLKAFKARVMSTDVNANSLSLYDTTSTSTPVVHVLCVCAYYTDRPWSVGHWVLSVGENGRYGNSLVVMSVGQNAQFYRPTEQNRPSQLGKYVLG